MSNTAEVGESMHRTTKLIGLEEIFKDHLTQALCHRQENFSLDQVPYSTNRSDLGQFQWWSSHNFSGCPFHFAH